MVSIDKNDDILISTTLGVSEYAPLLKACVSVFKSALSDEQSQMTKDDIYYYFALISSLLPTDKQAALMLGVSGV